MDIANRKAKQMKINQSMPEFCHAHSGLVADMENCKRDIDQLQTQVDAMRVRSVGILVTTIFTLIGVIVTLGMIILKK